MSLVEYNHRVEVAPWPLAIGSNWFLSGPQRGSLYLAEGQECNLSMPLGPIRCTLKFQLSI